MPKRFKYYEDDLIDRLKNTNFAAEYLTSALEEEVSGSDEVFLIALGHIAKAYGMTVMAEKSGVARQAIYRALSKSGNPEFSTIKNLLDAAGLKLAVEKKKKVSMLETLDILETEPDIAKKLNKAKAEIKKGEFVEWKNSSKTKKRAGK